MTGHLWPAIIVAFTLWSIALTVMAAVEHAAERRADRKADRDIDQAVRLVGPLPTGRCDATCLTYPDCGVCRQTVCLDHADADECPCGTWHHTDCAPECSEWRYWAAYSAAEDRRADW